MKKWKYLIIIIVISIFVFIGAEAFRNNNINDEISKEDVTTSTNIDNSSNAEPNIPQISETKENIEENEKKEMLKNGEELIQKAEKTVTARGWAGASNNIIGLKDGILYYYNKETEEFYQFAEGVDDIYFSKDDEEQIIAKKSSKFKEIKETPQFLKYE